MEITSIPEVALSSAREKKDIIGADALWDACVRRSYDDIVQLLRSGAKPADSRTAQFLYKVATRRRDTEILEFLLGVDFPIWKNGILSLLAKMLNPTSHSLFATLVLRIGLDVNWANGDPLFRAIGSNCPVESIEFLLQLGANPNSRGSVKIIEKTIYNLVVYYSDQQHGYMCQILMLLLTYGLVLDDVDFIRQIPERRLPERQLLLDWVSNQGPAQEG